MENIPTMGLVVALALVDSVGRWLMHQRPPGKHHAGLWEFPGGKVEPSEALVSAMIREAREELGIGLDASDLAPAGFAERGPEEGGRAIVILLYKAARWHGTPQALEGGAVRWSEAAEIAGLDLAPLDRVLWHQLSGQSAQ